jgi:putative NADPH-quinone reductase
MPAILGRKPSGTTAVKIALIQGHPDPEPTHFDHALSAACAAAARSAGHEVREITVARLDFALLKGRSARIVVTMGMPAFLYRLYHRAHSVKSLKRNILEFCGFGPVRTTLIGTVEGKKSSRERWLAEMARLARRDAA